MSMDEEKELSLCFVNLVGKEEDGKYRYEFIFTDNPDECWGESFEEKPCSLVNDLMISKEYKTETHIVRSKILFDLIQDNGCFGMQDCMDGIVAVAWENIDDYDSYPEDGRLIFHFGESIDDIERKLAMKNILMN